MWSHRLLALVIVVFLDVTAAVACGPEFPWQLLDNRTATLKETPANSFGFEAAHLVLPPKDQFREAEGGPSTSQQEASEGSSAQAAAIREMRLAKSGDEAWTKGAVLPAAMRLYTAGAVDFKNRNLTRACSRFNAVLALPQSEQQARATWAAFMLGRSYVDQGDLEHCSEAFKLTRELAAQGAPDPLRLALASYGDEARAYLRRASNYVVKNEVPARDAEDYSKAMARAAALYAQQAARGSTSGVNSLRMVAEELLTAQTKTRASVSDPLVERLLVAYVLAQFNDAPAWRVSWNAIQPYNPPAPSPLLSQLVDAIEANGLKHPAGADRLAALAYRIGRYDLAGKLAGQANGPLAAWIKAKLALQRGDVKTAAGYYAQASRAFPPADDPSPAIDQSNEALLLGERGVLTLARGEYVEALEQLYPMAETYWGDVAYIAERVLTVDELERFIDVHVPASSRKPSLPGQPRLIGIPKPVPPDVLTPITNWLAENPPDSLRNLLARRLVRAGRYTEAIHYFADRDAARHAAQYAEALHDAAHRWWHVDRARAWYQAALLARNAGMDMIGYEGPPDYFATGGAFDTGLGQVELGHEFVTPGERARFAASLVIPDYRFHYRYVAVDEASRAADLLPPRSQAFAAVLCDATGWMLSTRTMVYTDNAHGKTASNQLVHQLYQRYVKQGPLVPWATHFGHACPAPDFAGAASFNRTQLSKKARHLARHYQLLIATALILAALGFAVARRITVRRFP